MGLIPVFPGEASPLFKPGPFPFMIGGPGASDYAEPERIGIAFLVASPAQSYTFSLPASEIDEAAITTNRKGTQQGFSLPWRMKK